MVKTIWVQVPSRAPDPDFFQNLRANARFLLPSEARNKGENGLAMRGARAHFRLPLHHYGKLLVWGGGLYWNLYSLFDIIKEQTYFRITTTLLASKSRLGNIFGCN